ncbi:MAG TPA: hypothetical protein VMZ53_21895 [Kofleriaceae bacterium]|nr:hypothetical protein [Kofleriaceae bacterium]
MGAALFVASAHVGAALFVASAPIVHREVPTCATSWRPFFRRVAQSAWAGGEQRAPAFQTARGARCDLAAGPARLDRFARFPNLEVCGAPARAIADSLRSAGSRHR